MKVKIIKYSIPQPYETWWYQQIGQIIKVKKTPFIDSDLVLSLNLKGNKHHLSSASYGYKDWLGDKYYIYLNDTDYETKIRKKKLQKIKTIDEGKM